MLLSLNISFYIYLYIRYATSAYVLFLRKEKLPNIQGRPIRKIIKHSMLQICNFKNLEYYRKEVCLIIIYLEHVPAVGIKKISFSKVRVI